MRRLRAAIAAIFFFCFLAGVVRAEERVLRVVCLDVGQGDATLLLCDGDAALIDSGPAGAWSHVQDVLEAYDVETLRYLIVTHPHRDHAANVPGLLKSYPVETVLLPPYEADTQVYRKMINTPNKSSAATVYPCVGDSFSLGGASLTIYAPHPVAYSNLNDASLVVRVCYGDASALFCGDAQIASEEDMLLCADAYPLESDFLRVGHHGSDTSSSAAFIRAVSPDIAVVSCGEGRGYPSVETAMTLTECGIDQLFTTARFGDIALSLREDGTCLLLDPAQEKAGLLKKAS